MIGERTMPVRQVRSTPDQGTPAGRPPVERRGATRRARARHSLVLPVVLLVLTLLALLSAGFAFQVMADYAATQAVVENTQTKLVAEAGFQYVTLMLRDRLHEVDAWYDNEDLFRGVVVWSSLGDAKTFGQVEDRSARQKEEQNAPTYRFSLVADDPDDDEIRVRYGLTNEAAKLNINTATPEQLTRLIAQVIPSDMAEEVSVEELVDALVDWRDADDDKRPNGAESEYYSQLVVPYRSKNAPFDTVEELLMVRGFNGRILYGEDADRNGLMTLNENDGDTSFPMDDEDGVLNRGLYPYVTVYSKDYNKANDNSPRVRLSGGGSEQNRARLEEVFSDAEIEYLYAAGAGLRSLSSLADRATSNGLPSPFALEDFSRIVDHCTLSPVPEMPGLIDVNTAPAPVLRCLKGLSEDDVNAILLKRAALDSETKATKAWLLTQRVLDKAKYDAIADQITARGYQFTAELLGYGDHTGARTRLQIVFELRGPVPQIMYYRDLTKLGTYFPVYREEEESLRSSTRGAGTKGTG